MTYEDNQQPGDLFKRIVSANTFDLIIHYLIQHNIELNFIRNGEPVALVKENNALIERPI